MEIIMTLVKIFKMSLKHLSKGSENPPKVEGQMRLYGMKYCPFTQRVKLVLRAKDIPHDVVHINLNDKPEWFSEISPKGSVPVLDSGKEILQDSVKICEYLENYSGGSEPNALKEHSLIAQIGSLSSLWHKCVFKEEEKSVSEWGKEFSALLAVFENELNERSTKYFAGDNPGLIDFLLWPFAERSSCVKLSLKDDLPIDKTAFSKLLKWKKDMLNNDVVKETYLGSEKFWNVAKHKLEGTIPDYDIE